MLGHLQRDRIRMYLIRQERWLEKLLFQIVCISFEEF